MFFSHHVLCWFLTEPDVLYVPPEYEEVGNSFKVRIVCIMSKCLIWYLLQAALFRANTGQEWFISELFYSRVMAPIAGYTFTSCVGYFSSPGIDTR